MVIVFSEPVSQVESGFLLSAYAEDHLFDRGKTSNDVCVMARCDPDSYAENCVIAKGEDGY